MNYDVITIGTATRDVFIRSDAFTVLGDTAFETDKGICVPLGSKIDVTDVTFTTGGGATNTAVTFARQGYNVACLCRVGNDVSGREVLSELEEEGVSTDLVVQDPANKTSYSVLLLSEGGERTVLVYRGASQVFEATDADRAPATNWFHLTGALPLGLVERVIVRAHTNGARVAFNPSRIHFNAGLAALQSILDKVDVFSLNREEAARLTKKDYDDATGIFVTLDSAVHGLVVMTEGPKGVRVSDGVRRYKAGVFAERVLADRTGAGDAFSSGFVSALVDTKPSGGVYTAETVKSAIRLASANATAVVEHVGAKDGILTEHDVAKDSRWQAFSIDVYTL